MKTPTDKQMAFAEAIERFTGVPLPEIRTRQSLFLYIRDNRPEFERQSQMLEDFCNDETQTANPFNDMMRIDDMMKTILKFAGTALVSTLCFAMAVVIAALALHAWRHGDFACAVGAGLMAAMGLSAGALYAFTAGCIAAAEFRRRHD